MIKITLRMRSRVGIAFPFFQLCMKQKNIFKRIYSCRRNLKIFRRVTNIRGINDEVYAWTITDKTVGAEERDESESLHDRPARNHGSRRIGFILGRAMIILSPWWTCGTDRLEASRSLASYSVQRANWRGWILTPVAVGMSDMLLYPRT